MNKKTIAIIVVLVLVVAIGIIAIKRPKGSSDEIIVGGNFEMTGNVATYGTSVMNAVELAFDEVNKSGELNNKIVLVKADNRSDGAESANMARKLIDKDKVVAIIGPVTSTNAIAAAQVAQSNKIPLISPTGTAVEVTQVGNYIFRACFLDDFQGKKMANFAYNTLGSRKAAILHAKNDYSEGLARYFKALYVANGGQIVAEEAFLDNDTDFKAQLTKIKAAKPDMIYVPGYYNECGGIALQARQMGITVPLTGGDGWDYADLPSIAGAENLNNILFTNHFTVADEDPAVQSFVNNYKEKYGKLPDSFAALGYEAAMMLVDAIKRADSSDPEAIRQALAETENFKALSATITLDENRNPMKSLFIVELKNGEPSVREIVNP